MEDDEVRSADEYFDDIQDVKVTKDMLDLAKHIVNQKAGHFEPDKFEDQYETALIDLINQKRAGKPITAKERPRGENVVDLMDALRSSHPCGQWHSTADHGEVGYLGYRLSWRPPAFPGGLSGGLTKPQRPTIGTNVHFVT
jgi:hypothetical protein